MAKKPKAEEIINKVEAHYDSTEPLRSRMDQDYSIYRLDPYDAGEDFHNYTSNEPATFADKIVSFLNASELTARIPVNSQEREQREANDQKERFFIGTLRSADERLKMAIQPDVKSQLAWYITLRGWYAGRALLTKNKEGKTFVDITPFDPMHTYWSSGYDGLMWACYKTKRSKEMIESQYNVRLNISNDYDDWIEVYDYYDREYNMVVLSNGKVVKKATPHGSPNVPVFLGAVGANPEIQALNQAVAIDDTIKDYGESVFRHNRDIYDKNNLMMSIMLELTARARRQGLKIKSRDGTKTLDEDPYKEGTEISLAQGEDVEPLGLMEMSRETGAFLGLLSGELQRGALPHSIYGELQFQLSGFAINTLRQGINSILEPRIKALEAAYTRICMLLNDQYLTDAFDSMQLSGEDMNRNYFSEEITPDAIRNAGDIVIKFVGQLPEDDMSKMSMAQMAREGQSPLLPDLFIRDKILGLQDGDLVDDAIKEQQAERTLPEATLYTLLSASENRGRDDLAQFYYGELLHILRQKEMERSQAEQAMQQPQTPEGATPPTADPRVMPNAMMGVPPPTPTPPQGTVAPETPRPNAQEGEI